MEKENGRQLTHTLKEKGIKRLWLHQYSGNDMWDKHFIKTQVYYQYSISVICIFLHYRHKNTRADTGVENENHPKVSWC